MSDMGDSMNDTRDKETRPTRPLVVVITGPSSAGKSSLVNALGRAIKSACVVSLDRELEKRVPASVPCRNLKEAELLGFTVDIYHEHVKALAKKSPVVLCDHVLCGNAAWTRDLQERLADMDLYLVELSCQKDLLEARENARGDRPGLPKHALWQAERQAENPCDWGHLSLDSSHLATRELAARVLEALERTHPALLSILGPLAPVDNLEGMSSENLAGKLVEERS